MIFSRRAKGDPIAAFWTWWGSGRPRVEQAIAAGDWPGELVDELTARIDAVDPGLAWEFGAGTGSRHLLVVTANGNRALRAVAERWRRAGPAPDETFGYAASRQAMPTALESRLDLDGRAIELSALRFAAEVDDDAAQADVRVWHPVFADLPAQARTQIAFLALDWVLGEDGVEIWVRDIDTTSEPGPALTGAEFAAVIAALAPAGESRWAVLSGARGGRPVLASVQVPLKAARWPAAVLHVRLDVPFAQSNGGGLPAEPSLAALHAFEDRLFAYADGPVLVAHETTNGVRTYHLYADRQAAVDALAPIAASWPEGRVRTTVKPDPAWAGVSHLTP